jgi:transcriptional regulator with XRE-family HTH domain
MSGMPLPTRDARLRQRIERDAARNAIDVRRTFGLEIRQQREDAGISQRRLAAAAGISQPHLCRIEAGKVEPSGGTAAAISVALGAHLEVRLRVATGSPIRDHIQAQIVEALLRAAHPRWRSLVEVPIHRPVRGSIDIVFHDPESGIVLATEVQSQIRRLEQLLRWSNEKAAAILPSGAVPQIGTTRAPAISRLLVIRSTRTNRVIASTFSSTLQTAYPASPERAFKALTSVDIDWPGAALLWAKVDRSGTRILDRPPRGLR